MNTVSGTAARQAITVAPAYFKPGMSEETRAAIVRELCGFDSRVHAHNAKAARAHDKQLLAFNKANVARWDAPAPNARFTLLPGRERTTDAMVDLARLGCDAQVVEFELPARIETHTWGRTKHGKSTRVAAIDWADVQANAGRRGPVELDATDLQTMDSAAD